MNTMLNLFQQAQLADSAYADFAAFPNSTKDALMAAGFSDTQAADFITNWEVVDHLPNTDSGFSATLFRRLQDDPLTGAKAGELVFAIRGTEEKGLDLYRADFQQLVGNGLAFEQIVDMANYWRRLITPADESVGQWRLVSASAR